MSYGVTALPLICVVSLCRVWNVSTLCTALGRVCAQECEAIGAPFAMCVFLSSGVVRSTRRIARYFVQTRLLYGGTRLNEDSIEEGQKSCCFLRRIRKTM